MCLAAIERQTCQDKEESEMKPGIVPENLPHGLHKFFRQRVSVTSTNDTDISLNPRPVNRLWLVVVAR